ncbi:hypothetical protein [Clostridium sporogenes]|uniref:hypothetical protein n=1 Tax=Clostridium sporogenes TaxID=1509 RepID=UPI000B1DE313|nr:hypothetical protein [Clostridium sporogenes]
MNISVKDIDWKPKEFDPTKRNYCVFYDKDTDSVIGCGNILIEQINDKSLIYIGF